MRKVNGDWVHAKNGNHLDGVIVDGGMWQTCWNGLDSMPSRRYNAQGGKVGQRFM